jgi:hypothetical protein
MRFVAAIVLVAMMVVAVSGLCFAGGPVVTTGANGNGAGVQTGATSADYADNVAESHIVPEPAAMTLLVLGGLCVAARRGRQKV